MQELIRERYELALERIEEVKEEAFGEKTYEAFFHKCAGYISGMCRLYEQIGEGCLRTDELNALKERNQELYREVLPEHYEKSYLNPAYAADKFGTDMGRLLCAIYAQFRSMIGAAYEQDPEEMVIYMELFLEVYRLFEDTWQESEKLPETEAVRQIFYWFVSDYADIAEEKRIRAQTDPACTFALDIVMKSDLTDLRYLYAYGEYVSENELRTAQHMNALPEDKIRLMADTYTEGYRIGFEVTGKDLRKKKTVAVYYQLGFERMIRQAVKNFEKMGLKSVIYRPDLSLLRGKGLGRAGFTGANPNKQFDYDHKDDQALVLDRAYMNRRLDVLKAAYEEQKENAALMGGPAVVEVFGETPFAPESKPQAC
ncbi:MAG: leucyl aminopeptidase, partial [Lachnospiraceae bacterium]|nr:leucyl aminopeptidase [Lachnospiraceae bacterium]